MPSWRRRRERPPSPRLTSSPVSTMHGATSGAHSSTGSMLSFVRWPMHDVRPHVVVVTPCYPTTSPCADAGAFVGASVLSLRASHQVSVIHMENVGSDDDRTPS